MTSITLNATMAKKVMTMGMIAIFKVSARRPFQILDAERISEALRRTIRQITVITLISDTPNVANIPKTDVVLIVLLTVLIMDDNIVPFPAKIIRLGLNCSLGYK